ncbi:MAG: hypothetical protein JNL39_16230 [Opitutaceae bacterium]|nr:hypothetical protein [Opitutaceae bacterium]
MGAAAPQSAPPGSSAPAPSWLDAAGFAVGLGLAWRQGWKTADLVWSLWLSSLVVGYANIVWNIVGPVGVELPQLWRDRALLKQSPVLTVLGMLIVAGGGLFMLAFFSVHFGGFHFGHSLFLAQFFPVVPGDDVPPWATYREVVARYWLWLPVAFLAERAAFRRPESGVPRAGDTAVTPEAIRRRKAASAAAGATMMAPYKNVIRMHLLIFFFAGAHYAGLENFWVYAVVYAVYFCPWRWLWSRVVPSRAARS